MREIFIKFPSLFWMVMEILKKYLELFVIAAKRFDDFLSPKSDWFYIGEDTILYQTTFGIGGFQYVAQLNVDHQMVADTLGVFSKFNRDGAIHCQDDRYFYPACSEEQRYLNLSCNGKSESEARRQAKVEVLSDMERAALFGRTWFSYQIILMAKRGNMTLAKHCLRGVDAVPDVFIMDPYVDQLVASMRHDVEYDAKVALANLVPSLMGLREGV